MDPESRRRVEAHARPDTARASVVPRGADLTSAIYGSLLVTALVAAQARSDASPPFIAGSLVVGVGAFWLMEVWTELTNLRLRGPIRSPEAWMVARDELPMLSAAVVPTLLLMTEWLGWATVEQATILALLAALAQLFLWGLAVGIALGRGPATALAVAVVDCLLGIVVVGLKVLVLH